MKVDVVAIPPNTMPRIEKIWAFLSRDRYGNEGLCAAPMGSIPFMPLIASDEERLKQITPIAEKLAAVADMTIVLVEFTTRTELREIKGKSS